ncbi:hypothetical protein C2G38_2171360 [Gigaspora rosea]|uniref:Uncharacterized protein n=1 Tax=Gigaspora rosea TaxID=44941 RepID=A0A397VWN1_9GLOM|nr:hypothetical protein C2G38_2171360 [Gigaspora rosea]
MFQWSIGNILNPILDFIPYEHTATLVDNYMFVAFVTTSYTPAPLILILIKLFKLAKLLFVQQELKYLLELLNNILNTAENESRPGGVGPDVP